MNMTAMQRSVFICALYGFSSLTLSLLNKAVLSQYQFNMPFLLLAMQSFAAFLFVSFLKAMRARGGCSDTVPEIASFNMETFKQSIPLGLCFVGNIAAGFMGLHACSVPMFLVVRRTTTFFVLLVEFVMLRKAVSGNVVAAVMLICAGAFIAGWETLDANIIGYMYVISNNFLTAVSLNLQKKFSADTGTESFAIIWYTSLSAVPAALALAGHFGEFEMLSRFPYLHDGGFIVSISISVSMGAFISYTIALCATVNSPLAATITGNLKDILATFLGWALFGGFEATFSAILGLATSFSGAALYSVTKLRMAQAAATKPAPEVVQVAAVTSSEAGDALGSPSKPVPATV